MDPSVVLCRDDLGSNFAHPRQVAGMVGEPKVTHLDHDTDASFVGVHGIWNRDRIALRKADGRCTFVRLLVESVRCSMPFFLGRRRTLE